MTYTFRIGIDPAWHLHDPQGDSLPLREVLQLLNAVESMGHIAGACRACGVSYRHAWGVLRRFEAVFGVPLLVTQRRLGTTLTPFASKLLWANRRIQARLSPTLESLASELQEELQQFMPTADRHLRLHGSHGFAVAGLLQQIAPTELDIEFRYRSSSEALAALVRGECDLAGFHVPEGAYETPVHAVYARWLDPERHVLIHLVHRHCGLFVAAGNPLGIRGLRDLARPDLRFVNRQPGSGTRMLLEMMLAREGVSSAAIPGFDTTAEFTHAAVAAHIASDMGDVGIGVETAGRRFGLDFIPLLRERYFFAAQRAAIELPAMQDLLSVLRSPTYHAFVTELPGYDADDTGRVLSLDEAFAPMRRR